MTEVLGMDSRWLFTAVVGVQAGERLWELVLSRANAARTLARGGVETGRLAHLTVVVLHVGWLAAAPLEVWLLGRPLLPWLAVPCALLLVPAMALRYWAITTLGDRWNTRVITVPGEHRVRSGPFRWLRHPNYLALYVELFALPLLHTAWLTAAILGPVHAAAVWYKSRIENRALGGTP